MSNIQLLNLVILALALMSIAMTAGVVWRVERKLDTSFKFILISLIFFTSLITFDLFRSFGFQLNGDYDLLFKLLFILFFIWGIYKMRRLIKDVNDEIINKEVK